MAREAETAVGSALGREGSVKRAKPRYRWRTWLRGVLPDRLHRLVPKGARDCRAHEWYRADEESWRCYHCEVGVTHTSPWTPEEEARFREAALLETLRYLNHKPLTAETVDQREAALRELDGTVAQERELIST